MLARLAHLTVRHRWPVIGVWLVLTLFGAFAAGQVSTRWYQSLAVPGKPAYEASQRTLDGVRRRRPRRRTSSSSTPAATRRRARRSRAAMQRAAADDAGRAHELATSRPAT